MLAIIHAGVCITYMPGAARHTALGPMSWQSLETMSVLVEAWDARACHVSARVRREMLARAFILAITPDHFKNNTLCLANLLLCSLVLLFLHTCDVVLDTTLYTHMDSWSWFDFWVARAYVLATMPRSCGLLLLGT